MFNKLVTGLLLLIAITANAQNSPKREFRGAWIHTVGNQNFRNMSSDSMQTMLKETLDILERSGVNAVIFQVRPQADALYISSIEPWSRFITGEQGRAPQPLWDPLQFMIEESHKRGMELHAWLNPYRVTSNDSEELHPSHLYFKKPHLFKRYGKQLYFDPGEPESVEHTVKVIADIVSRYDLDAIHFDDYFYPYPIKYEEFHDDNSFVKYSSAQGFEYWQKGDWRRNNVTTLIREINDTIKSLKPWIRFGISPFGIHRNLKDTPDSSGSNTDGLSNYDQLFADVPFWIKNGWIDYNVPQLYWKIGHPVADYKTLIEWWNRSNYNGHLYIGQNISTFKEPDLDNPLVNQSGAKMKMVRELKNVHGNVWWPGWSIAANRDGFADSLANSYQKDLALIPIYTHLDSIPPATVKGVRYHSGRLSWDRVESADPMQSARFYAVYRFPENIEPNIEESRYLVKIVKDNYYTPLSTSVKKGNYYYIVTALDPCWNESSPSKLIRVKH